MAESSRGGFHPPNHQRGKRQQITAACESCRTRKKRCIGGRPCEECVRRNQVCIFDAGVNETQGQAVKRKLDAVVQAYDQETELLQQLAAGEERNAWRLVQRLRSGESVSTIAASLHSGVVEAPVASQYERNLVQSVLITLLQSRAALDDLVPLAQYVLSHTRRMNLVHQASQALRDKVIALEILTDIASGTPNVLQMLEDAEVDPHSHYFYVPAEPWTEITSNNEAVSHLISVFLRFGNGYWRFVEEDLFLRGMRSRKPLSEYCSPLLVNAMCSWASTYSEIDEAFTVPGQYLTRGNNFFEEARRLWRLEDNRSSITNVSALMIMAVDGAMRGKDTLAPVYCKAAVSLLKRLPDLGFDSRQDKLAKNYVRARRALANGVIWEEFSNCAGLMRHLDTLTVSAVDMPSLERFPSTAVYWTGHPFIKEPIEFPSNMLIRERRTLACFMEEILRLVAPGNGHPPDRMLSLADSLGAQFVAWHDELHPDLIPREKMPSPLFEFHVQCYGVLIQLYNRAWKAAFGDSIGAPIEEVDEDESDATRDEAVLRAREHAKTEFPRLALKYAYRGATLLRYHRECYGMKICVPYIIQHAAENIFVLLLDLPRSTPPPLASNRSNADSSHPIQIDNTHDAFVECFRTLLGSGAQVMLPRAITRMVFHTAIQLQIRLPNVVERMLDLVAGTSWAESDLLLIDSMWPNLALKADPYVDGDPKSAEMGELLRKWEQMGLREQSLNESG